MITIRVIQRRGEAYGLQLARETGIASGSLYPMLERLVERGWLARRDEEGDKSDLGRPLRRYYRLTEAGEQAAEAAIKRLRV